MSGAGTGGNQPRQAVSVCVTGREDRPLCCFYITVGDIGNNYLLVSVHSIDSICHICDNTIAASGRKQEKQMTDKSTNTTLRASPSDPRFLIQKDGWDGAPRSLTPPAVIERPIWEIGYCPVATKREDNPIAYVTNFRGEGPTATVRYTPEYYEAETKKRTVKAKTLNELYELVIETYFELQGFG